MWIRFLIILFCCLVSNRGIAQNSNRYQVINALSVQLNKNIPVLDSLWGTVYTGKNKLYKENRAAIKKNVYLASGYRLQADSLPGYILRPALPVFTALVHYDATKVIMLKLAMPFYIITDPVFFNEYTKCYVGILYYSEAATVTNIYILTYKNNVWVITQKEVL